MPFPRSSRRWLFSTGLGCISLKQREGTQREKRARVGKQLALPRRYSRFERRAFLSLCLSRARLPGIIYGVYRFRSTAKREGVGRHCGLEGLLSPKLRGRWRRYQAIPIRCTERKERERNIPLSACQVPSMKREGVSAYYLTTRVYRPPALRAYVSLSLFLVCGLAFSKPLHCGTANL